MTDRITSWTLREFKAAGKLIAGLTAYDYPTAMLVDQAGLDLILVGDSLGRIILGHTRIEQTTINEMIHHCAAVSRGSAHALVVGDMPFGTYEIAPDKAVENALRLMKEGGVGAVKVEGGLEVVPALRGLAAAHIPVVGHLEMSHVQRAARSLDEQQSRLIHAAIMLEEAGADAIVLVGLAAGLAKEVTATLKSIPTVGYQSGPYCDGQLLVTPYMLGLLPPEAPIPGPYGALGKQLSDIFAHFRDDVRMRTFLTPGNNEQERQSPPCSGSPD